MCLVSHTVIITLLSSIASVIHQLRLCGPARNPLLEYQQTKEIVFYAKINGDHTMKNKCKLNAKLVLSCQIRRRQMLAETRCEIVDGGRLIA
jgi:hypothetical protein